MKLPVNVKYTRPLISIQDMINFIDKGEKFLRCTESVMSDVEQLEYFQGIILSPDYQREYRSKVGEESSIIESIILNIPIPEIFLVKTNNNEMQLRHVMDGQHRLTAIYRFIKDKYALSDLELLKDNEKYKNKKFSQLDKETKFKILGSHLSVLEFETFDDDEMEIELFKRYNRNTKPLEKHEMSMATYYSNASVYITRFLNDVVDNATKKIEYSQYWKIYNITADRKNKQRNHQELCIIMNVLLNGLTIQAKDGVEIADKFLSDQATLYRIGKEKNIDKIKEKFLAFNQFMLRLSQDVEYPFSTAVFKGDDNRSTKFHTGVSIILAAIYYYFDIDLESKYLHGNIKRILQNSPVGDETYNASSTNMKNIIKYFCDKNKVFDEKYEALTLKKDVTLPRISQTDNVDK